MLNEILFIFLFLFLFFETNNGLQNVPPPSFGYEEESSAQDFFGPFAWTPVLKHPFFAQLIDPHKVTLVALP